MRPPICAICHERFPEDARLLSFALSEADIATNERFKEPGFVGHPAGREWFCGKHAEIAEQYIHLHLSEALPKIRESIQNRP